MYQKQQLEEIIVGKFLNTLIETGSAYIYMFKSEAEYLGFTQDEAVAIVQNLLDDECDAVCRVENDVFYADLVQY